MRIPTRDRTRRAGLAVAAALLIALPALAAPTSPVPAAGAEVTEAASWTDAWASLWQRLLAAVGVPVGPQEPIEPQPGDDDTTLLRAYDDKGDSGPSLDPNGRF